MSLEDKRTEALTLARSLGWPLRVWAVARLYAIDVEFWFRRWLSPKRLSLVCQMNYWQARTWWAERKLRRHEQRS